MVNGRGELNIPHLRLGALSGTWGWTAEGGGLRSVEVMACGQAMVSLIVQVGSKMERTAFKVSWSTYGQVRLSRSCASSEIVTAGSRGRCRHVKSGWWNSLLHRALSRSTTRSRLYAASSSHHSYDAGYSQDCMSSSSYMLPSPYKMGHVQSQETAVCHAGPFVPLRPRGSRENSRWSLRAQA